MSLLPPILLHYYITERCNCRCTFCDIWKNPAGSNAKLADVERNLLQARQLGVRFVDFTGGEPLLHPDLPEMLYLAKKLHLQTSVTTNCLLYPRQADVLAGKIDYLHFSLDAMNAALHNRMRGKNTFDAVMQSITLAKSLRQKPDLLYTVTQENLQELPQLADFARLQKLILIVNPVFSHTSTFSLDEDALQFIESFARQPYVYVNRAFHRLRRRGGNEIENPRCRVMDSTIVISPQNELLLPCYHFAQTRLPIDRDLRSTLASTAWQENYAQQGKFAFCNGCTLNCYFDPSFQYKVDVYFLQSLAAKAKYIFDKHLRF